MLVRTGCFKILRNTGTNSKAFQVHMIWDESLENKSLRLLVLSKTDMPLFYMGFTKVHVNNWLWHLGTVSTAYKMSSKICQPRVLTADFLVFITNWGFKG